MNPRYLMYMEEYIREANEEMCEYQDRPYEEPEVEVFEEEAEPVYKINYYLRDHLQKTHITPVLAKKEVRDAIIDYVASFLNAHVKQLSTAGPVYKFTFREKEAAFLYKTFNLTPEECLARYTEMEKETYSKPLSKFITGWVQNAPHKMLINAILIDAVQHGYKDIIECCEYLWAFAEYAIVYDNSWPLGVKEDVMDYTIEHLGSKFKVTKVNNLKELLKYDTGSSIAFFMDQLKQGADNVYIDLMRRIRNQIKSTFTNIARVYYVNSQANATMHQNVSTFDDGTIADQEGLTTSISQIVDNTNNKFANKEINQSILGPCAENSQVDKSNLASYISQIYSTRDNKVPKLVEDIITAYFVKFPNNSSLNSIEFLNFGLSLYRSIGTSKDPIYQEIRSILDYWMFNIIDIKSSYSRPGTIINYTRAIFNYIVFMINHYND